MNNHRRPRGVLHCLRNGFGKPIVRFSSWSSAMMKTSDSGSMSPKRNKKYAPQQRKGVRGAASTAAAADILASDAELETPLSDPHRCTSHSYQDDDDGAYQQFLGFLNSPTIIVPPLLKSENATTSTDDEGQLVMAAELRGCYHEVSTEEENKHIIESYVVAVDAFEQTMDENEEDASICSVPSLSSIPTIAELEETDALQETDTSVKDDVDSAMAWCALVAVLGGCPAPSSVPKKAGCDKKMKEKEQLWVMDDIPDLHFDDGISFLPVVSPTSEGAPAGAGISFDEFESDDEEDSSLFIVPDVEDDDGQDFFCQELYNKTSVKKAAESTLAWSALALLLGAPPPAAVATRRTKNVWRVSDENSNEVIPILHLSD